MTSQPNNIQKLEENLMKQMEITNKTVSAAKNNSRKTIPIAMHPSFKQPSITNIDAFHFSVGSILGDGTIDKTRHTLDIEQRSARFAMWKRGIAIDTGLIANHSIKGNYKKRLKLANGQIVIHLPLTWKGRVKNNGPSGKPVYRRGWAFTTRALYHDPQWRSLFYKKKTDNFVRPGAKNEISFL